MRLVFYKAVVPECIVASAMKISIANLSEGVHTYHFSEEPEHVGLGEKFTKMVSVDVTLEKASREVFLKVKAVASGRFTCDRCVDEFNRDVFASYRMVYIYDERDKGGYGDDGIHVIHEGTSFIDLRDDMRQFLLLSVPLKILCSDQCNGLCPYCGRNRNHGTCSCKTDGTDPRWETLQKQIKN